MHNRFGMNFNNWINLFRIREATEFLRYQRMDAFNMTAIAKASGFGTRMSMYLVFHKLVGMTPEEYKKKRGEGITVVDDELQRKMTSPDKKAFEYVVDEFADLQVLRYKVPGFEELSLKQKIYVYYLSEAALHGRDIIFDQNGKYNLRLRKLLEEIYATYRSKEANQKDFQELVVYLKRIWFSNGIHHHYGCDKFIPEFSFNYIFQLILEIHKEQLPLLAHQNQEQLAHELCDIIFNPSKQAKRVSQADGVDLVKQSSCHYYENVSQAEAEAFYAAQKKGHEKQPVMFGMNSKLVKLNGELKEVVWKLGGMYHEALKLIVANLKKALPYTDNERQQKVIQKLIEFYSTGDLKVFDEYSIAWLRETTGRVDFINGFIETYGDPLGLKASWEAIVNLKDVKATKRTKLISDNAQWFEDHSPIAPEFKRKNVKGVSAKVVVAAMLAGDLYPSTAIGINLPNSNWIRAKHGSKSVTISNLTDAYNKASHGNGFLREFAYSDREFRWIEKYGDIVNNLHTDLHECLGHGSGQLLPGVDQDALKAYGATIEEARADLFGLYFLPDEKMVELGFIPEEKAFKAGYYSYIMNGLMTQLVRIEEGQKIEESHMRNRQLIARWAYEFGRPTQVIEFEKRDGKTYVKINDYQELRALFGLLLSEVQRIKSEGDYEAARHLVERYGVQVDEELHAEVMARYKALHLKPYKGFVNPKYTPKYNNKGDIVDVKISYEESYEEQMLRYSKNYSHLI
jgi:dipeptidyl-peptidase-3